MKFSINKLAVYLIKDEVSDLLRKAGYKVEPAK